MHPSVVGRMPWTADFEVSRPDERPRTVRLLLPLPPADGSGNDGGDTAAIAAACNAAFEKVIRAAYEGRVFRALLSRPLGEDFRVLGARYPVVRLKRPAAGLFGVACRGAHMTVYTRGATGGELRIWVPRRSAHLRTWPGRLDTSVAGGVAAGESPLECVLHEADEEASLPAELVRRDARPCGAVTYLGESGAAGSGGEPGLLVPDVLYVYDLEVGPDVVPRPRDDEVEAFHLWDVPRVREALLRGEFKTNSASVMVDFFVRHGLITDDNEPDYLEILTRLHRVLPMPLTPR